MDKLNPRHERFVAEYLIDRNAYAAYLRAGYKATGNSARVNASHLLRHPSVRAAIEAASEKTLQKLHLTAERVLLELAKLCYSDVRKLVDKDGKPIPIELLDDDTAASIVGLKWRKGVPEYKLADKNTSIGNALKVLGLLRDKVEVTDTTPQVIDPVEGARRLAFVLARASAVLPATVH